MAYYFDIKYDEKRDMIRNLVRKGKDWDYVYRYGKENDEELQRHLDYIYEEIGSFSSKISAAEWKDLVIEQKETFERAVMVSNEEDQELIKVPTNEKSSWQLYKQKLADQGFSSKSILELEESTLKILSKLSRDTTEIGARKGLMIGHVQSGKTASMAGLMAMAADYGWNMFIVLSGIIENLRAQTEKRLISDLTYKTGNLSWRALNHLSKKSPLSDKVQSLSFDENSRDRFFTVCLKNKTRLENLTKWLYEDKNKLSKMKILVIDDEADQAGINTANIDSHERTAINSQIIKLVEGPGKSKVRAMNYISYTATPYANVLNEAGPRTLYPKDFIGLLPTSTEYFGPKQIFGVEGTEYNGLNIIREIKKEEVQSINTMQKNSISYYMTDALRDSIAWFLCAVSMMRNNGYKKPISMLIHTSHLTEVHGEIAKMISTWLDSKTEKEILEICKGIYEREKQKFSVKGLYSSLKEYSIKQDDINGYPPFELLIPEILELKNQVSHIKLGDDDSLEYHDGIHLCIDNCKFNKTEDDNFIRLAYPDKNRLKKIEKAPAFMIVGGNTLSRGLTLEGLVSTYFLRVGRQADTLMQMGRWFGYRHGYELYPRIWMTEDTRDKFVFLATLEEELREELKIYQDDETTPEQYGLKIKNSPKVSWLRITNANRSQGAITANWDFSGASTQTVKFDVKEEVLKNNVKVTESLLNSLETPPIWSPLNKSSLVWKGISFEILKEKFFSQYMGTNAFNNLTALCKWFDEVKDDLGFTDWNVIVGGTKDGKPWEIAGKTVGKITRSRKDYKIPINIGVLRAPADLYADFSNADLKKAGISTSKLQISNRSVNVLRERAGLGKTPLLMIYRIDKEKIDREDPNFGIMLAEDPIGFSILIPREKVGKKEKNFARSLEIDLERFIDITATDVEE